MGERYASVFVPQVCHEWRERRFYLKPNRSGNGTQ